MSRSINKFSHVEYDSGRTKKSMDKDENLQKEDSRKVWKHSRRVMERPALRRVEERWGRVTACEGEGREGAPRRNPVFRLGRLNDITHQGDNAPRHSGDFNTATYLHTTSLELRSSKPG